jgi:arylsulfatase A-like enzyme
MPGATPADSSVVSTPVELTDVGPTLAEAAGVQLEYPQWGRSLLPVVRGESRSVRDVAVSAQQSEVVLVGERWKAALNRAGEVYLCVDLADDPLERINLAGTEAVLDVEREARSRALAHLLGTQLTDEWF